MPPTQQSVRPPIPSHSIWLQRYDPPSLKKKIVVGTDCSGIEAPIHALQRLGISYTHQFSSDIDQKCRAVITEFFRPRILSDNMFGRDLSSLGIRPHELDIYVCGFPCQAFSAVGKKRGFDDSRGIVFFECMRVIETLRPRVFILENVQGLKTHDHGKTLSVIMDHLNSLSEYTMYIEILNTKNYGIPHNRPRMYFVGIQKKYDKGFSFPEPFPLKKNVLDSCLETHPHPRSVLTTAQQSVLQQRMRNKDPRENYIVNVGVSTTGGFGSAMKDVCPCLLSSHRYYYSTRKQRFLTIKEWMILQGFDPRSLPPEKLSYKQLGNTMSVNVLVALFDRLFQTVSWTHPKTFRGTSR